MRPFRWVTLALALGVAAVAVLGTAGAASATVSCYWPDAADCSTTYKAQAYNNSRSTGLGTLRADKVYFSPGATNNCTPSCRERLYFQEASGYLYGPIEVYRSGTSQCGLMTLSSAVPNSRAYCTNIRDNGGSQYTRCSGSTNNTDFASC